MWKAFKFCIIAFVILGIAWWVASLPGNVSIHAAGYEMETPVSIALLLLVILIILAVVLTRLFVGLRRGPARLASWRKNRRHEAGEIALQRGLVAVAAQDASSATAAARKAKSFLGDKPILQWINAEAARLVGKTEDAKQDFEHLTQTEDLKFLGLQGLLRIALQAQHWDEAEKLAEEAENAWPGGSWTRQQRVNLAIQQQNYSRALQLTQLAPERAALAIAAAKNAETPDLAIGFAKQAIKAESTQPMAIVTLARALRKAGKDRAARKVILKGWEQVPCPLLADAWFSENASPLERAQEASKLVAVNLGHVESELLLAQTALAADLKGEARVHAEAAKAAGNKDGRADAILAALHDQKTLSLATVWQCSACASTQEEWAPVCPTCGKIGTLVAKNS